MKTKKIKDFRGKGNPRDFRGFETKFQTFEKLKFFKQMILYAVLSMLLIQTALAIGVAPVKTVIDFEPGSQEITVRIINNEHKDFKAVVYSEGELAEYVELPTTLVTVKAEEDSKSLSFNLNLPEKLDRPGTHEAKITILEFPKEFATEEATAVIRAVGSVVTKVVVRVPYPGLYAEADLFITQAKVDKPVIFTIPIYNFGEQDIKKAKATITIYGATYEKIAEIYSDEKQIKSKEQTKLVASWMPDVNPGVYHASVKIDYDGRRINLEKNFNVGNLFIEISKVEVEDFILGGVARFDIYVESKWNELIKNVYGEMTVKDKKGGIYATSKTASVDIPAYEKAKLQAYWDTKDVQIGLYDVLLKIHYADKTTERLIETQVNIDSIQTRLGLTAQVVAKKSKLLTRDSVLVLLVIILIVINISWFIYFRKRKK